MGIEPVRYTIYRSRLGDWVLWVGKNGLKAITYGWEEADKDALFPNASRQDDELSAWRELLDEWFRGRVEEDRLYNESAFDLSGMTSFQKQVLAHLCRIPRGQTRTYGQIAKSIGSPQGARAVGQVLARNPIPLLIPCHRVVPAHGGVGHYSCGRGDLAGAKIKSRLLSLEGVNAAGEVLDII